MTKLFEIKPFIIAEAGSNWRTFEDCKNAIPLAKNCGANAIKFQVFNFEAFYGVDIYNMPLRDEMLCNDVAVRTQVEGLNQLSLEWLPLLKEKADACGIELMCSSHSPELVDIVDPFVSGHIIASSDNNYPQLLLKVAEKGKPLLLQTGGSSIGDIAAALRIINQVVSSPPPIILMYCANASPSNQLNLFHMKDLAERFELPVGLSDHSLSSVYIPLSAHRHFNAVVIEKHVNFFDVEDTRDCAHSLDATEFKYMCDFLRGVRKHEEFGPQPEEREMFLRHNRRLMAIRDIPKDQAFVFGYNYGAYRSLKDDPYGLSPMIWRGIEGKGALCDIKAGEPIGPKHVPPISSY